MPRSWSSWLTFFSNSWEQIVLRIIMTLRWEGSCFTVFFQCLWQMRSCVSFLLIIWSCDTFHWEATFSDCVLMTFEWRKDELRFKATQFWLVLIAVSFRIRLIFLTTFISLVDKDFSRITSLSLWQFKAMVSPYIWTGHSIFIFFQFFFNSFAFQLAD